MDWSKLGGVVSRAAPLLGSVIAGPGGAAIASAVASAFGVENTPDAIHQAVSSNPDAAVRLREIESRHVEQLERIALDRHITDLQAETSRHHSSQQTIQTEYQHGTDYAKNTRPKAARISVWATVVYVLVAESARIISAALGGDIDGASVAVAGMLFAPCGTYMGMRTADSFSRGGRT